MVVRTLADQIDTHNLSMLASPYFILPVVTFICQLLLLNIEVMLATLAALLPQQGMLCEQLYGEVHLASSSKFKVTNPS